MNITTKPTTEERPRMSEEAYNEYVKKLKSNAKRAWKKSIFSQGLTVKEYEQRTSWMNFEIWKFINLKNQNLA